MFKDGISNSSTNYTFKNKNGTSYTINQDSHPLWGKVMQWEQTGTGYNSSTCFEYSRTGTGSDLDSNHEWNIWENCNGTYTSLDYTSNSINWIGRIGVR